MSTSPSEQILGTAMLQALLDAAVSSIIAIDACGHVQTCNDATLKLFGYAREALIGQNINILMPEPFRSHHDGYLTNYLSTGVAKIIGRGRDVKGQRKDGSVFPMHLEVGRFALDGAVYFVGIIRDITEEEQQRRAIEKTQRMEALGQLTGGMAHDFNNLLAVMSGNIEMLQMRLSDPAQLALANQAAEAAAMGARLTQRLLTFARRSQLEPTIVSVNEQVRSLEELLRRTLGEQIALTTKLMPQLWRVQADPSVIENAIINLAINARDAMPNGGSLIIETRNIMLAKDEKFVDQEAIVGDYMQLSVTDTGTGMSANALRRAFEPFFTTKGGQGTGLGLSTVYGHVKQSGGNVSIYSEVGIGTTVSLYLPRAKVETREAPKPLPAPARKSKGEWILLVEDNAQMRTVSHVRLGELGYQVKAAHNGAEAIAVLETNPDIQLVFSDIVMPGGVSGYDLARWVHTYRPHVKILLTSGFPSELGAESTPRLQALKILRKPHSLADLSLALRQLLDED
jgi:PAS domain S-box-containing protein